MNKPSVPAYALPFVTRAFRGGRLRRYVAMSALLSALTVLLGWYFAIGRGQFEQEVRVELGHESSHWETQRRTFTISTRSDWEHAARREEASRARAYRESDRAEFLAWTAQGYGTTEDHGPLGWNELSSEIYDAHQTLLNAVNSVPQMRAHKVLRDKAATALRMKLPDAYTLGGEEYPDFDWRNATEVSRLGAILDNDMVPAVKEYKSPLGFAGAVRFTGGLAALLLSLLALVLTPLLVAVNQSSEVHENTLQPLTGTSLSPAELARGLRAGPFAVMGLFAIPLAAVVGVSALAVGTPLRALFFFAVIAAGAYGLSALSQLLGQIAGVRRTPGIVGVALMLAMGGAWLLGTAIGFDAPHEMRSMIGATPQSSAAYLQIWALGLMKPVTPDATTMATLAFGAFAWVTLGALASRVLAHRIGGLEGPALSRTWALGGGVVAAVLACLSSTIILRGHVSTEDRQLFYFVDLLVLAVPYGLLLMTRVPISEAPPKLRSLPVLPLLGELFALSFIHMVITSFWVGAHAFDALSSPVALLYLVWAICVVGLVAIRAAALPIARVTTHLWFSFCALCVLVAGAHVVGWTVRNGGLNGADDIFALGQLSPLLGLLQIVCLVGVPLVCLRGLSSAFSSLSHKAPTAEPKAS